MNALSTTDQGAPLIVGLTGSIGSGKSEAARALEALGATIVDADLLAREVTAPGSLALSEIEKEFGPKVLNSDGSLNRKALGQLVFSDIELRKKLENITHPKIRDLFLSKLQDEIAKDTKDRAQLVVYVVPLLFESGYSYPELKKVIVVSAPREICLSRIQQRDNCSLADAAKRYEAQLPIDEKVARADYVIKNDGDLEQLRREAGVVFRQLRDAARNPLASTLR